MGCCGAGSHEPEQNNNNNNNNSSDIEKSGDSASPAKNILTWGLVIIVIVGLLAWLF